MSARVDDVVFYGDLPLVKDSKLIGGHHRQNKSKVFAVVN